MSIVVRSFSRYHTVLLQGCAKDWFLSRQDTTICPLWSDLSVDTTLFYCRVALKIGSYLNTLPLYVHCGQILQ